jgi:hypothetical protein
MRWAGALAFIRQMKNAQEIIALIAKGINHSGDLGVDKIIIFKWILKKKYASMYDGLI